MHAYAESLLEIGEGGDEGDKGAAQDFVEKEGKVELRKEQRDGRMAKGGTDAVIICGGSLRGDSQYGPGKISLGDILGTSGRDFGGLADEGGGRDHAV